MATLRHVAPRRSYWEDTAYPTIAAFGLMVVMFSLAVGAVIGLYIGDLFAGQAADPARSQGVIESTGAWNPAVLFFGASMLMTAVVVTLRRIIKTIGVRGEAMQKHLPTLFSQL